MELWTWRGYFPEEQLSLSLTSNGVNYKMNDVLLAILGSYFGDGFELPDFNYLEIDETVLDQYIGEYTSDEMPLDITITRESNTLFAQATGQSAFALDATEENVFVFDAAGIRLEFDTSTDKLRMQQGNGDFSYSKKQASAEIEQSKINVYQADDLEQYIGNYKNAKLPFDLLLSVDNNTLVAQATGQSAINLTPTEKHIFTFDPAGIKMEFDPESNNVRLLQNGGNFVFVRE